jgi:hypothetical protein
MDARRVRDRLGIEQSRGDRAVVHFRSPLELAGRQFRLTAGEIQGSKSLESGGSGRRFEVKHSRSKFIAERPFAKLIDQHHLWQAENS